MTVNLLFIYGEGRVNDKGERGEEGKREGKRQMESLKKDVVVLKPLHEVLLSRGHRGSVDQSKSLSGGKKGSGVHFLCFTPIVSPVLPTTLTKVENSEDFIPPTRRAWGV